MHSQKEKERLLDVLEQYQKHALLVEGKRDAQAMNAFGFSRVFILNVHRGSLRERVERIAASLHKKEDLCLLFDNDAAGRRLIAQCAPILRELGFRIDQTLRRELINAGLSHIEGVSTFVEHHSRR